MSSERNAVGRAPADAGVVQRVALDDAGARGIELLAAALGCRVYDVSLAGCHDKAGLLERTAEAMGFPAWFGHNWDAWFDCLADLGWQAPVAGHVVLLRHAAEFAATSPEACDTAIAILEEAGRTWAERGVVFRAFIDTSG
jgi:hypothetical protein